MPRSFKRARIARAPLALALVCVCAVHGGEDDAPAAGRLKKVADPADALCPARLTDADAKRIETLFAQLASEDFDERRRAEEAILAFGPRAAAAAKSFEASDDADTRQFARRLPQHLILRYRGYLPVAPELKTTLSTPRRMFIGKQEGFQSALERFLRDCELTAAFDWKKCPDRVIGGNDPVEIYLPAREGLGVLLNYVEMAAVPRGNGIAVVPAAQSANFEFQEHVFPVASLNAAERARLAEALGAWLPPGNTAAAEESRVSIRGSESAIRMAARALYAVAPDALGLAPLLSRSAIFPNPPGRDGVRALFDALEIPVLELSMAGIEPLRAIARLRAAGYPLEMDDTTPELVPLQPPVTLDLRDLPLGALLRWMALRANAPPKTPGPNFALIEFSAIVPDAKAKPPAKPRILVRLSKLGREAEIPETVGCADVSFLFAGAREKLAPADADKSVCGELRAKLAGDLALFPFGENDFALMVFNRRVIARGPAPLIARLVERIDSWRESGQLAPVKWREEFAARLRREIDWNGGNLTIQTLLPRLRERTGLNILLNRENASATDFEIDSHDAGLLPPGKTTAMDLILKLCAVSKSTARVKWGAIVLTPRADGAAEGKIDLKDAETIDALLKDVGETQK